MLILILFLCQSGSWFLSYRHESFTICLLSRCIYRLCDWKWSNGGCKLVLPTQRHTPSLLVCDWTFSQLEIFHFNLRISHFRCCIESFYSKYLIRDMYSKNNSVDWMCQKTLWLCVNYHNRCITRIKQAMWKILRTHSNSIRVSATTISRKYGVKDLKMHHYASFIELQSESFTIMALRKD